MDHGQLAYEARFEGMTLGPRGISPAWADLPDAARSVWRRVEDVVTEAVVNSRWRLLIETEQVAPLHVARIEPGGKAPVPRGPFGEPAGFRRGAAPPPVYVPDVLETEMDRLAAQVAREAIPVLQDRVTDVFPGFMPPGMTAARARDQGFSGNMCDACGAFEMKRAGTCETCQACGTSGGCG